MKKVFFLLILSSVIIPIQSESPRLSFRIELDQMMLPKWGFDLRFETGFSIQSSVGISPFTPTMIGFNLYGLYNLRKAEKPFQMEAYLGIPIAYGDAFEGRYTDRDPYIEHPYFGFLAGGGVKWSWKFQGWRLGLRTGIGAHFEWSHGSLKEIKPIPEISLDVIFSPRR